MLKDYEYTYYVDEKEKQIICRITKKSDRRLNNCLAAQDFCLDVIRTITGNLTFIPTIHLLPAQCIAISKCHPDETFSEETGKRVARDKLRKRLMKAIKATLCKENSNLGVATEIFCVRTNKDLLSR